MLELKILQLSAPLGSLGCVSIIVGPFMKRRKPKGPLILNTFTNLVKSNFSSNSLGFSNVFNKIH